MVGWPWGARCAGTAVAGYTPKCAGLFGPVDVWVSPPPWTWCVGAAIDWTVVRVVAIDRIEGAGDENVLSLPPSRVVAVAPVPAPEGAASERAVSAWVARVGALDLLPPVWLSCEMEIECLLWDCDSELCLDLWEVVTGVEKDRWPFV